MLGMRLQIDFTQIKGLRSLTCWMTYRSVFTGRPSSSCTRAPCSNALHVSEARTTSEYRVHSYCRQTSVEMIRRFGPHLKSSAMSDDSTACVRTAKSFCCLCLLVTVHKPLLSVMDLGVYPIRIWHAPVHGVIRRPGFQEELKGLARALEQRPLERSPPFLDVSVIIRGKE